MCSSDLAPAGWAEAKTVAQDSPATPAPARIQNNPVASPAAAAKKDKPATASFNAEEFKNDPLIQKALEVFKGRIVEVRA